MSRGPADDVFSSLDPILGEGSDGSEEDDDIILSSPYGPVIKELMRRILRAVSHVRSTKEKIDAFSDDIDSGGERQDELANLADQMSELLDLFLFLWGRLLKVLFDEHERYGEVYSRTLDMQDRAPFEALTHTVHHNSSFCDLLGEILDASYERRPYEEEVLSTRKRAILKMYYQRMEKVQMNATFCAVLVVEGSRESFLDPVSIEDLCKTVVEQGDRRRRLVHLSLLFSMLAQDEQSVAELLAQGADRVILQRFRHLTHRLFGIPQAVAEGGLQNHPGPSPLRYTKDGAGASSRRSSPHRSRRGSPSRPAQFPVPTVVPLPPASLRDPAGGEAAPDSPVPAPPSTGTFPPLDTQPATRPPEEVSRKRRTTRDGVSPTVLHKSHKTEEQSDATAHAMGRWTPLIGDRVARGPGWCQGDQAAHCDFGRVVGFTDAGEVVVQWGRSADARASRPSEDRMYRYSCRFPTLEIVPLDYYLQSQTKYADKDVLRTVEFMLTAAVTGMLCQQPETILPALQFQAVESALHVLDCIDLHAPDSGLKRAREQVLEDMQRRYGDVGVESQAALTKACEWSPQMQRFIQWGREQRDNVARILWVFNGLLSHKKLCMRFLELSGLARIQALTNADPGGVSTALGCTVVLAHLAKHSVFEELLRNHYAFFAPMMEFIMRQWEKSENSEVRARAGSFLHYTLSFPYTLQFFDLRNGAAGLMEAVDTNVKSSEEQLDVINPGVQLAGLKCLNTYITAHLMLSTKVIFRKHRVLSAVITNASPYTSLPRDPATVESVIGFLWAPSNAIPDVTAENVFGLLAQDRLTPIHRLIEAGLHHTLLRCINFYFIQSRWELLVAALQGLCVLTVIPYIRRMVAEPRPNESGIPLLLVIIGDLASSYNSGNTTRESYLLPCVLSALQVLVQMTTPPNDVKDDAQVAMFDSICGALRAHDGVRILLDLLKIRKDSSLSAKLRFFPVIARGVQLMVVLKRFADTSQLFEALGVHRVAQDLLQEYGPAQREYISMMGQRKLLTELDPADWFMENVKWLMPQAFGDSYQVDTVRAPPGDPVEVEMRRAIVGRASIDYTQSSLFALMAEHLEAQGLHSSAYALREEAGLAQASSGCVSSTAEAPSVLDTSKTLDGIVRSYLRQQQERCPNPIETLPRFDLTKKHVYIPPPAAPDKSRNAFNRLLARRTNERSLRYAVNENCLTYRNPAFVFDIMSEGDMQGDSICFCDGGDAIITGTSDGSIYVFDTFPEETMDKLLEQHIVFENEGITSLVMSPDDTLLGVINERHNMSIMQRSSLPVARCELSNCRAARFSRDSTKLLITSGQDHLCRLTDLATQNELAQFSDRVWSGDNSDNVAQFDATSTLVLHDAVLWDLRCSSRPIFRFDRITESFASAFHPSNHRIIIDEKIWDIRSLQIVQTVPVFRKTNSFHYSNIGKVIYSFREASAVGQTTASIVSAVDSYSFEVVFSEEVLPTFRSFALDPSDRYCAAILDENRDSPVRIFSTASGPSPDRRAFAAPVLHENPEENDEDNGEEEEDEVGDWSMSDDFDFDDDDDDDDEMESSATYSGEGSGRDDGDFDDYDDDDIGDDEDESGSEELFASTTDSPAGSSERNRVYDHGGDSDDSGLESEEEFTDDEESDAEEAGDFEESAYRLGDTEGEVSTDSTSSDHST